MTDIARVAERMGWRLDQIPNGQLQWYEDSAGRECIECEQGIWTYTPAGVLAMVERLPVGAEIHRQDENRWAVFTPTGRCANGLPIFDISGGPALASACAAAILSIGEGK